MLILSLTADVSVVKYIYIYIVDIKEYLPPEHKVTDIKNIVFITK